MTWSSASRLQTVPGVAWVLGYTIASEIAIQLEAEKLVLLTDVDGIYLREGEPETKLSRLTADDAEELIKNGSATAGMIPKLQSIIGLLRRGVKSAHIINGTLRNALLAEVFTDNGQSLGVFDIEGVRKEEEPPVRTVRKGRLDA